MYLIAEDLVRMITVGLTKATTFVETGTFRGVTLDTAMSSGLFMQGVSIEMGDKIYEEACEKFRGRPNIQLLHGDSALVLPAVLEAHPEPCFFWLDAHKSGHPTVGVKDGPLPAELRLIIERNVHDDLVMIDDVNVVQGLINGAIPLSGILDYIERKGRNWTIMHFPSAGKNGGVIAVTWRE